MGVPLTVTEWMKGYVGFGEQDPQVGFKVGLREGTYLEHEVNIEMDDIDRFVAEPAHLAPMTGHVRCDRLGGICPLEGATYNMLVDAADPLVKYMFYRLPFVAPDGKRYTMLGHKTLRDDPGLDLWGDITTLEVRVFAGDVAGPDMTTPALGPRPTWPTSPIAVGVIQIQAIDGIKSAMSFRSPGSGPLELARAVETFCSFYARKVWDLFGIHHASKNGN